MAAPIHQQVDIKANPRQVYEALTESRHFATFSGQRAEIGEAGERYSCFNNQITGRILEMVPEKKIVQTWRVAMWPEGVDSTVKIELTPHDDGTRLTLEHSGFPEDNREHLESGWPRMYWEPLRKYLA